MDINDILYQLKCIATADVTKLLTVQKGDLTVADTDALDKDLCAAIASIEKASGGIKIKFYDKLKALELLGKHLGMWDGSGESTEESPLLQTLLSIGGEVSPDEIPEARQTAAAGDDLVESPENQRP